MSIHVEYRYHLDVDPQVAFTYLADPAHDIQWQSSCLEVRLITEGPVAVGTRYHIVFSFMGRRICFISRVAELVSPTQCAFESVEGPFQYQGRYGLNPARQGGVEVHWQFWAEPGRFFGIVPSTLLRKLLLTQVEKDVEELRRRLGVSNDCRGAPGNGHALR